MTTDSPSLTNSLKSNEFFVKNRIDAPTFNKVLLERDLKLYTRPATSWESTCEANLLSSKQ